MKKNKIDVLKGHGKILTGKKVSITQNDKTEEYSASNIIIAHPKYSFLIDIILGETNVSSSGFPYISEKNFRIFLQNIPHLFIEGQLLLEWLNEVEKLFGKNGNESVKRSIKVIRTIILTASVTSPSDLWLMKQIISTHKELGIIDWLLEGNVVDPEEYAENNNLQLNQLEHDLHFLYTRGYLIKADYGFVINNNPVVYHTLSNLLPVPSSLNINIIPIIIDYLKNGQSSSEVEMNSFFNIHEIDGISSNWIASNLDIELGFRILPLVLGLRVLEFTSQLKENISIDQLVPNLTAGMKNIIELCG
jgi:hypothetical protein